MLHIIDNLTLFLPIRQAGHPEETGALSRAYFSRRGGGTIMEKKRKKEVCLMDKELMDYVKEKTADLLAAPMCCKELRAAAEAWLAALGTEKEADAAKAYVAELEADVTPVDGLIAFTESDAGKSYFGESQAAAMAAHGRELKDAGRPYCDCPACSAAAAILEKKAQLL